ncbi:abc transporter atp-binding protein : Uncultured bacterium genome assembly Metasoil_fosmids_resub OS=uncultured bacterium PE=4 SV=1: DUF2029 [Gemmata massiliana]|uniref:DUF2029 domain-containing protein n=1 Tax=Gemmata massiliana TaxID=1210884 RepID=A0A6P2DL04_9BACT|nr:glycosyltransferase 87 family protein [Gemmata massiliana]VTS01221.1 abc transporter atp-binding protein : Uncultured bacterium genome assembly Metasoil_fosmids_resub OS=uncultured bacterium PE=4 SV=1: DUF2029 [Gemmata massiliana]
MADRTSATWILRFAPAVLLGLLGVQQALVTNHFPDLFIYRAGSELGLRGESPYNIALIRQITSAQFPDDNPQEDSFILNCGYFLPPSAAFVFAPFAALAWPTAKIAWGITIGFTAVGIASLPDLFRKSGAEPPIRTGVLSLIVRFSLVLNPLALAIAIVGQVTIVSVGCVAVGLWCFSYNRPTLGVVLWSVVFVKPHVALPLIPLAWYLGGWKPAATLVALVAGLNLFGAAVMGGSPLFLKDYFDYLPTGHKAVLYNQAERNPQITSWNRLLISCGGPPIELSAITTIAGYLVWGGLVVGRCAVTGRRPSAPWACAAAVSGAVVCCQVLVYELLMLVIAVPWIRDLFAGRHLVRGWTAVLLLVIQTIPINGTSLVLDFYRPGGALAFALLVLLGPIAPEPVPRSPFPQLGANRPTPVA